jgi:hypothetical protein
MMSVAKRVDEDRARFGPHRPHRGGSFARALDDLASPVGRRRRPGNDENAIVVVSRCALGKLDLDRRSIYDDALDGGLQVCVGESMLTLAKRQEQAGLFFFLALHDEGAVRLSFLSFIRQPAGRMVSSSRSISPTTER